MSDLSIEQAAHIEGWKQRAEFEAAAVLAEVDLVDPAYLSHGTLVSLLSIAWLQGYNVGAHQTLSDTEAAFERLRASL